MLSRASGKLLRKHTWKRWVLNQGLNYVKSRSGEAAQAHRRGGCLSKGYIMLSRASAKLLRKDTWKRWVLKQGLHYVQSRISEAAAQGHMEEVGA